MKLPRAAILSFSLLAGLLLASCGGGDPYAGLWQGNMNANRDVNAIVLGDGTYYMLYSKPGAPQVLGGFMQGTGEFRGAHFNSDDGRDFNWEGKGTRRATLDAKISPRMSVTGSVNGATPFSVRYQKDFDAEARLSALVGAFTGEVAFFFGTRPAVFTVSPTGQLSTTINGCSIGGQVVPRSDANAYDLTITFGGSPCIFPNVQFNGVAIYREELRRIDAAVIYDRLGQGIAFTGIK